MSKFRSSYSDPLPYRETTFPASIVQSGMSPSISQMVKTRAVGGTTDEYEMDGIDHDAPFDSEYLDFFDMQDEAERLASEAAAAKKPVPLENTQKEGPGKPESDDKS